MEKGNDGTNYTALLIQKTIATILKQNLVSYIGTVVKISPPKVSVQPSALTLENKKQALVDSALVVIPAIKTRDHYDDGTPWKWVSPKVDLKVGDQVLCVVIDHDTQYYRHQSSFRVNNRTPHQITDSIVIGKIASGDDFDG